MRKKVSTFWGKALDFSLLPDANLEDPQGAVFPRDPKRHGVLPALQLVGQHDRPRVVQARRVRVMDLGAAELATVDGKLNFPRVRAGQNVKPDGLPDELELARRSGLVSPKEIPPAETPAEPARNILLVRHTDLETVGFHAVEAAERAVHVRPRVELGRHFVRCDGRGFRLPRLV